MSLDGKQVKPASLPLSKLSKDLLLVELTSTFTVAGTTLADVTGLTFSLKANATYLFDFELMITQATATSIVGIGINFTGTLTRIGYSAYIAAAAATIKLGSAVANNTAIVDTAARAIGGPFPARVSGSIVTTAAGTLSLRAQRSAATTTILASSSGRAAQL